jgi:hypothetical protein
VVSGFPIKPANSAVDLCLNNRAISELCKGLSEAYESAGARAKARNYLFLQSKFSTRFNSESRREKVAGWFFEYVSGYGLRPSRVIASMCLWFLFALIVFSTKVSFEDSLLLTCGALFTFGAKAELLNSMGIFYTLVYISSSFVGISLTALFITVLVNVFIRGK